MAPTQDEIAAAHKTLFEAGIQVRREVAGPQYVSAALDNVSDYGRAMQELVRLVPLILSNRIKETMHSCKGS